MRCDKCGVKSRTNYTHGCMSRSVTTLLHEPWCDNKDFKKSDKKKVRR